MSRWPLPLMVRYWFCVDTGICVGSVSTEYQRAGPWSLMSVSSSSYSPSCQRAMSMCREKSQHALFSAASFHWSKPTSKLVPGSTRKWSTAETTRNRVSAPCPQPGRSVLTDHQWWLTDGGGSSGQRRSGSLVEVVGRFQAFLGSM